MYNNMMKKFEFGNASDPNVYLEENNLRMCSTFRNMFVMLASDLYEEGKRDSAKAVLDYALTKLPISTVPLGEYDLGMVDLYYRLNQTATADKYASEIINNSAQFVTWLSTLKPNKLRTANSEFTRQRRVLQTMNSLTKQYGRTNLALRCEDALKASDAAFQYVVNTVSPELMPEDEEE